MKHQTEIKVELQMAAYVRVVSEGKGSAATVADAPVELEPPRDGEGAVPSYDEAFEAISELVGSEVALLIWDPKSSHEITTMSGVLAPMHKNILGETTLEFSDEACGGIIISEKIYRGGELGSESIQVRIGSVELEVYRIPSQSRS